MRATTMNEQKKESDYKPLVKDLMTTELFTLYKDDSFQVIDVLMKWKKIRHIPVVNDSEELVGLITQRDYLKAAISSWADIDVKLKQDTYKGISVAEVMTEDVASVSPYTPLATAARILIEHKYGCLPVVENSKLVGILTEADFVKSYFDWEVKFFN